MRRAPVALFGGAEGKDTVRRKAKGDWDVWNARSLKDEPIIRLILDGTVVRVRGRARPNVGVFRSNSASTSQKSQ